MAETNKQVVLRRLVAGKPSLDDLELVEGPVPEPREGEVLVRTIYLSLDPYMRGRMGAPEAVGKAMVGGVVGEVVASNAAGFEPGQLVCQYVGGYGWQSYGAVAGAQLRVLDPGLVPITTAWVWSACRASPPISVCWKWAGRSPATPWWCPRPRVRWGRWSASLRA